MNPDAIVTMTFAVVFNWNRLSEVGRKNVWNKILPIITSNPTDELEFETPYGIGSKGQITFRLEATKVEPNCLAEISGLSFKEAQEIARVWIVPTKYTQFATVSYFGPNGKTVTRSIMPKFNYQPINSRHLLTPLDEVLSDRVAHLLSSACENIGELALQEVSVVQSIYGVGISAIQEIQDVLAEAGFLNWGKETRKEEIFETTQFAYPAGFIAQVESELGPDSEGTRLAKEHCLALGDFLLKRAQFAFTADEVALARKNGGQEFLKDLEQSLRCKKLLAVWQVVVPNFFTGGT